jgi:RHS repeat-associated protein
MLSSSVAGQFNFGYDTLSRRTSLTRPNGVSTAYNYDSLSRLLSVLHQAGGTTIDGAAYAVDAVGNRTAKQNLLNGVTENYTYDLIYQLTQAAQGTNVTESYAYDAVGNRLTSLTVPSLSYNSSNELLSTSRSSYTYDYNGNLTSKTNSSGTTGFTWDYENRLTSVTLPGSGGTVTFKYDPFGRRIQKSGPAGTTNYLYDGANVVTDLDLNGAVLARYTQGVGIDEPLASVTGFGTAFFEADGLGSVTSLSGASGLTDTYTYKPFGITTATGSNSNRFRFTGREWDSETNLYYYRARYYDPQTGRFISEDPTSFQSGDVNFYVYVSNFPTGWVDPFGLVEGSPANLAKRKAIANAATGYEGSHDFDFESNGGSQYPPRSWKCSLFVCTVVRQAGAPIAIVVKGKSRCATAGELANPRWNPKNWRVLGEGEQPLAGDVAAVAYPGHADEPNPYTGHSAVVTPNGFTAFPCEWCLNDSRILQRSNGADYIPEVYG